MGLQACLRLVDVGLVSLCGREVAAEYNAASPRSRAREGCWSSFLPLQVLYRILFRRESFLWSREKREAERAQDMAAKAGASHEREWSFL